MEPGIRFESPRQKLNIKLDVTPTKKVRIRFSARLTEMELDADEAAMFAEAMLRKARDARLIISVGSKLNGVRRRG